MKTVIGLFDEVQDAEIAVHRLLQRSFDRWDISVLASDIDTHHEPHPPGQDVIQSDVRRKAMAESAKTGAGTGAVVGSLSCGVVGLLVGMETLALPGLGALVAVGPMLSTLTAAGVGAAAGAAVGGLVGALVGVGVPEHDAHFFAEAVRRGGILVLVQASDALSSTAADVLADCGAVDVDKRREHFEAEGFEEVNVAGRTFTVDDLERERQFRRRYQPPSRAYNHL